MLDTRMGRPALVRWAQSDAGSLPTLRLDTHRFVKVGAPRPAVFWEELVEIERAGQSSRRRRTCQVATRPVHHGHSGQTCASPHAGRRDGCGSVDGPDDGCVSVEAFPGPGLSGPSRRFVAPKAVVEQNVTAVPVNVSPKPGRPVLKRRA